MTTWENVIKTGDVHAVKDYIASGANINAAGWEDGKTALMMTVGIGWKQQKQK